MELQEQRHGARRDGAGRYRAAPHGAARSDGGAPGRGARGARCGRHLRAAREGVTMQLLGRPLRAVVICGRTGRAGGGGVGAVPAGSLGAAGAAPPPARWRGWPRPFTCRRPRHLRPGGGGGACRERGRAGSPHPPPGWAPRPRPCRPRTPPRLAPPVTRARPTATAAHPGSRLRGGGGSPRTRAPASPACAPSAAAARGAAAACAGRVWRRRYRGSGAAWPSGAATARLGALWGRAGGALTWLISTAPLRAGRPQRPAAPRPGRARPLSSPPPPPRGGRTTPHPRWPRRSAPRGRAPRRVPSPPAQALPVWRSRRGVSGCGPGRAPVLAASLELAGANCN
jgi:hypothetical protein